MKETLFKKIIGIKYLTNIFEKEKNGLKLKSLLKIISKYHPEKIRNYKIKSGGWHPPENLSKFWRKTTWFLQ